jgi:hypothetical protein
MRSSALERASPTRGLGGLNSVLVVIANLRIRASFWGFSGRFATQIVSGHYAWGFILPQPGNNSTAGR